MEKSCLHCGTHFTTNRSNKKYCSLNCKQMAYFKRNGMVLAGASTNAMTTIPPELKPVSVKHDTQNVKQETVKYDSPGPSVKYETEPPAVKSVSETKSEAAIEELFDRLVLSLENKFNKALEKAVQELNEKNERHLKSVVSEMRKQRASNPFNTEEGLCNEEVNGIYCNPCTGIKYLSEKAETSHSQEENNKTDFTNDDGSTDKANGENVLIFPQVQTGFLEDNKNLKLPKTNEANYEHQAKYIPLKGNEDEATEDELEYIKQQGSIAGDEDEEEEEAEEDEEDGVEEYDDLYDARGAETKEENDDEEANEEANEEEYSLKSMSAEQMRIAELEKELEKLRSEKKEKVQPEKEIPRPPYKYIESRLINRIEKQYENLSREYLHHNIYSGWELDQLQSASWLNQRLRCLIESMIKLTIYAKIDIYTLQCLTDAFSRMVHSKAYYTVPDEYEYKHLIMELAIKLDKVFKENRENKELGFKIPLDLKARLIAIRREMLKYTQPMKFSEMDFTDTIGMPSLTLNGDNKSKAKGWQERYAEMKRQQQLNAA